jgi:hypothetical protein
MRLDQIHENDCFYMIFSKLNDTNEAIDLLKLIFLLDVSKPSYEYIKLDIPEKSSKRNRYIITYEQDFKPLKFRNECVKMFYFLVNDCYDFSYDIQDYLTEQLEVILSNDGIFGLKFQRHSIDIAKIYCDSGYLITFENDRFVRDLEEKQLKIKLRNFSRLIEKSQS